MGKFMLKDTKREIGLSPWNAVCKVGARVGDKYRYGNVAIVFDEILSAINYINSDVLRKALLQNPEKTARLLGIEVKDLREVPTVAAPIKEIASTEEIVRTDASIEEEPTEPEEVEPDDIIENSTQEMILEVVTEEPTEDPVEDPVDEPIEEPTVNDPVEEPIVAIESEPEAIEPEEVEPETVEEPTVTEKPTDTQEQLTPGIDLISLSKPELIIKGKELGIELTMKDKKDDMIAKISNTITEME